MIDAEAEGARGLPRPGLLIGLIAVSSAAALMLEIVAGRLVAPYLGMSLHSWTAIIAVVLAGLSLGALLGGRLADDPLERGRGRLVGALGLAALFTLLSPVLLRRTAAWTEAGDLGPTVEVLVVASVMLFVPSVFAGLVSPIATRLALAQTPAAGTGRLLGWIFAAGAAGSIVGTLLAGFVLIGLLGSLKSILLIAALYGLAALSVLPRDRRALPSLMVLLLACGSAWAAGRTIDAWRTPCLAESAYSCIRLDGFNAPGGGTARLLVIDHLPHGANIDTVPDRFVMAYLDLADRLARHRFDGVPPTSFFLGGGAYTLPRAWLADGGAVTVAEIDPLVTATAERHLWLERSPTLDVLHTDARRALARMPAAARYDVIFGDAFQDVTVPPHLVTREFAERVRDRLAADGLYMVNVIDRAERPAFAAAVARTLETTFPAVTVWRESTAGGGERRVNHLIVASTSPLELDEVRSGPPFARRWVPVTLDVAGPVLTDDYSPVERLLH
ncbi:MAG: fused MFS/spermidine synthase [Pseudomonadota bacterium]